MTDIHTFPPEVINTGIIEPQRKLKVSSVPAHLLYLAWPAVERILGPHLQVISGGRYDLYGVKRKLITQEWTLWVILDGIETIAVAITGISEYPCKRMLSCHFCAGTRMREWAEELHNILDAWRRDNGCQGTELTGRRGWGPVLKKLNWKEKMILYEI